jgi:hypothetical protein
MKFILYDIILNVFQVDEAYEAHASIQDKFILLSTPGDKFRNLDGDKFLFDFSRDDTYTNHSSEKVNIKFRVYSNGEPNRYQDYYACISIVNYLKLCWRFKKLWLQKRDNVMWLINLLVAILAIIASTYATIEVSRKRDENKIEIKRPIKLDEQQLNEIIKALQSDKINTIDISQLKQILR